MSVSFAKSVKYDELWREMAKFAKIIPLLLCCWCCGLNKRPTSLKNRPGLVACKSKSGDFLKEAIFGISER